MAFIVHSACVLVCSDQARCLPALPIQFSPLPISGGEAGQKNWVEIYVAGSDIVLRFRPPIKVVA